jgi:hypothetical protein
MTKMKPVTVVFLAALMVYSCSKRNHPSLPAEKKDEPGMVKTAPAKPRPKETIAKVIIVNDRAARKSVDGRYYYDLDGHRYWRNNKDGKYYLFNKSMYTNEAFKAKGN